MTGELELVLSALGAAEVRYLVVGGVAVVLHGHLRVTADLDLIVELEPENLRRALDALNGLRFRPRAPVPLAQFADAETRESWVREKGLTVFSLWSPDFPALEIDLFVREPLDFGAAFSRAVRVELTSCTATVIALADLITLKQQAGRPRDREDIEALRALEEPDDES